MVSMKLIAKDGVKQEDEKWYDAHREERAEAGRWPGCTLS